jgi:hypothetical protein
LASAEREPSAKAAPGALRLTAQPDAARLSQAVAGRVAGEVRSRLAVRNAAKKNAD